MVSFSKYKYWKWSNSHIPCDKSMRKNIEPPTSAIKSTIKNEIREIMNNKHYNIITPDNKNKNSNKRDVCNDRISKREMIIQTNVNPFLTEQSHVNNISVQDVFLRPHDSNFK